MDRPEHVESNPVDNEAVLGELECATRHHAGPAELLTLSTGAAAALYRATSEQADRR